MKAYEITMSRCENTYYHKYSTNLKKLIKEYYREKRRLVSSSVLYVEESRHFKGALAPYFSLEVQDNDDIYKVILTDIEIVEE